MKKKIVRVVVVPWSELGTHRCCCRPPHPPTTWVAVGSYWREILQSTQFTCCIGHGVPLLLMLVRVGAAAMCVVGCTNI